MTGRLMAQKALPSGGMAGPHDVDPLIRAILCAGIIVRTFALTSSGNGKKLETGIFSSMADWGRRLDSHQRPVSRFISCAKR